MMTNRIATALASKALSASEAKRRFARAALVLSTALTPIAATGDTLPTGGTVVHGTAQISTPTQGAMTINQGSDRAVVNWDGFSIGAGNRVDIHQPNANSAILNRVTGDTTSQIHGQLNANGRVFVVNPNGIFIGPSGSVNSGSFVASTLGIRTDDFVTGKTVFEGNGSSATVENAGRVEVVTGGYAALIGGKVKNSGTIQAPLGFVGLGSGERVTLDLAGDGFLQVAVPTNSDDDGLEALIENSGTIQANGGTVQISAATARNAARHAINLSGVVEARTVSGRNGRITLGGGSGGKVTVTGKVRTKTYRPAIQVVQSARPAARPERGGDITITGQQIALAGAEIDASGINGGGDIRIGGALQGAASLPTADILNVDSATRISADGITAGDGGRIILWSDLHTTFAGNLSTRGGAQSGNGGFAEVSGKQILSYTGLADGQAPNGESGTLLLDPTDIEIVNSAPGPNQIDTFTLEGQLAGMNVIVATSGPNASFPDAGEPGNIDVQAAITWPNANTLTLQADQTISINAPITAPLGTLNLNTTEQIIVDDDVLVGTIGPVSVATFIQTGGDWRQVSSSLPTFNATNFALQGGDFIRALGGTGAGGIGDPGLYDPYQITDVYGLQGMPTANIGERNFMLVNDIDASGTTDWFELGPLINGERNRGFVSLFFSGDLEGDGYAINDLFIDRLPETRGDGTSGGLFRSMGSDSTVQYVTFNNATVGGGNAGIVTGQNFGGTIRGVSVNGNVITYGRYGGGLVGLNSGVVVDSTADVAVIDALDPANTDGPGGTPQTPGQIAMGGLVGSNTATGTIDSSDSRGSVLSTVGEEANIGGLAGENFNTINDVISEASVSSNNGAIGAEATIGGLVGDNNGMFSAITNGLVLGPVVVGPACCDGFVDAFAVVGSDDPSDRSIVSTFWDTALVGLTDSGQVGETFGSTFNGPNGTFPFEGAYGETTAFLLDADAFFPASLVSGWNPLDTWAPPLDGLDYARLYTTYPVLFGVGPANPSFVYNATVNHAVLTVGYIGGPEKFQPSQFQFGPRNDSGLPPQANAPVVLSGATVGPQTYTLPTTFTSNLGQAFTVRSISQDATITPAPLTVTVGDADKPYGEVLDFSAVPFTATTLLGSDQITAGTIVSPGNIAAAPISGPEFPLNLVGLTGPGLTNYTIDVVPGNLRVLGRGLTVNIDDASKTYGDTITFNGDEFTVVGLVNGDTLTSLNISSAGAGANAQVVDGPFDIVGDTPVGTGIDNYVLNIIPGQLTVVPAPLTVTADDQSKPFGTEFVFQGNEFTVTGLLNSDSIDAATLQSDAAADDAPIDLVGRAILITDPTGTGVDNYDITLVNGLMVVAPGNLIITANDQTKVYGGEFTFDGSEFTVTGLAPGDSVDSVTLASAGAAGTAQVGDGPFAIVASNPVGTGLAQYTLIFADGTMTVVPAPLTITANDQTKPQGIEFTFDGTEFTTTGLQNADSVDSVVLSSDGAAAAALADDSPFDIIVGAATGTGLDNYDIASVNGTLTVDDLIPTPVINPIPPGNIGLPNPTDTITIGFPGSTSIGGGTPGSIQDGGTGSGPQQTLPDAERTFGIVDTISTELELAVQSCGSADQDFTNYMACLSESLDTYANALDEIANDLPPGLESVSATIRTASQEVRAATARAQRRLAGANTEAQRRGIRRDAINEARGAINTAKEEIRKAISLIRADDPEVQAVHRQTGARIIQAFDTVDSALVRATEL
ncbi:MAG: MBG domain-containing protein [Sulfitobacter sp.]